LEKYKIMHISLAKNPEPDPGTFERDRTLIWF
jgi:hypothetical protein